MFKGKSLLGFMVIGFVFSVGFTGLMANEAGMCHEDDVNSDGFFDLVCQVPTVDLALELGTTDTSANLNALTFDGVAVEGSDAIRIIKDCN